VLNKQIKIRSMLPSL